MLSKLNRKTEYSQKEEIDYTDAEVSYLVGLTCSA